MTWRTDYEEELAAVFSEAERLIDAYPAPLGEKGQAYLQAFNPLRPSSTKNHICYLLPFWIEPVTKLTSQQYRDISLANVFVMLYFFIQDDLMDDAPSDWKERLALGNLFHLSMLDLYRSLFDHDSPFWNYFNDYVVTWSLAVAYEHPMGSLDPAQLARKAAPVKLASTGALLLAGNQELVQSVSHAVDLALATLQFSDDWADWEEDFDLGSANSLIGMITSEKGEFALPLTKEDVKNAIFLDGVLTRFAQLAAANSSTMDKLSLPLPHLTAFQVHLADQLTEAAEKLNVTKRMLMQGGFDHFLYTNISSISTL
ncbi:hypothetical protein GZH47_02865 [Paenibacillus rhizovicinus]|uniref:Class 1 isoprenoid biosynthesis enzyme n=1 Tax=Paenibacillus rhizovicinus TaxID=2704463 RepID=A0A6C0NUL2_9BACL|nr:hypothetical protein [Paenibacillus rhizovicinus]QHW29875.1 hypothetical protein GZH47_02865 [Paenibacillus rhizovicinus]